MLSSIQPCPSVNSPPPRQKGMDKNRAGRFLRLCLLSHAVCSAEKPPIIPSFSFLPIPRLLSSKKRHPDTPRHQVGVEWRLNLVPPYPQLKFESSAAPAGKQAKARRRLLPSLPEVSRRSLKKKTAVRGTRKFVECGLSLQAPGCPSPFWFSRRPCL